MGLTVYPAVIAAAPVEVVWGTIAPNGPKTSSSRASALASRSGWSVIAYQRLCIRSADQCTVRRWRTSRVAGLRAGLLQELLQKHRKRPATVGIATVGKTSVNAQSPMTAPVALDTRRWAGQSGPPGARRSRRHRARGPVPRQTPIVSRIQLATKAPDGGDGRRAYCESRVASPGSLTEEPDTLADGDPYRVDPIGTRLRRAQAECCFVDNARRLSKARRSSCRDTSRRLPAYSKQQHTWFIGVWNPTEASLSVDKRAGTAQ